jgi:hypothetical protein
MIARARILEIFCGKVLWNISPFVYVSCVHCLSSSFNEILIFNLILNMNPNQSFNCNICDTSFITLSNLNRHLLKFHQIDQRKLTINCSIPQCSKKFANNDQLIDHLQTGHSVQAEKEELWFDSDEGN